MDFVGVDYGSKLAGTTVVCYNSERGLLFEQSPKKQDADAMLIKFFAKYRPSKVFIDAPLSLPKAFFDEDADDYFYRKCDREVRAMSPMFLGGLTARAIQLKNQPESEPIRFFEAYPRGLVDELSKAHPVLKALYKNDPEAFTERIEGLFNIKLIDIPQNWHQVDALLAYLVGVRFSSEENMVFGDATEGLIYV